MRRDPESRIMYAARKEIKAIQECERTLHDAAATILEWCRASGCELSDDEYRAVAFIFNKEYEKKRGSLALLYQTKKRLDRELAESTKETVAAHYRYRFRVYCAALKQGGYA